MQVLRVPLAALFVVALLFSAVQCVASCAALDCKSAAPAPPCHQHHDRGTSKACPQDLNLAVVHRVVVTPNADYVAAPVVAIASIFVNGERATLPSFSPPHLAASSSSLILRI
jgi:hypothetical protein